MGVNGTTVMGKSSCERDFKDGLVVWIECDCFVCMYPWAIRAHAIQRCVRQDNGQMLLFFCWYRIRSNEMLVFFVAFQFNVVCKLMVTLKTYFYVSFALLGGFPGGWGWSRSWSPRVYWCFFESIIFQQTSASTVSPCGFCQFPSWLSRRRIPKPNQSYFFLF